MKLKKFIASKLKYSLSQVAEDIELSEDIKQHLKTVGYITSATDDVFGAVAIAALNRFQKELNCREPNIVGPVTASKLLEVGSATSRSANAKPLTIKTTQETIFKQAPVGEAIQTVGVPNGKSLKVVFFEEIRGHLRITLTAPLEGLRVWYVPKTDVEVVAGDATDQSVVHPEQIPPSVKLSVPYKSQRDNHNYPDGTCNVTALAMCIAFLKPTLKPASGQLEDELYRYAIDNGLNYQDAYDMAKIVEVYGLRDRFETHASIREIKEWLAAGNPAVTHGYFTPSGHIITLVGYDENGFIVHDPFGEWFAGGYDKNVPGGNNQKGMYQHYSYKMIMNNCFVPSDQSFWVHFISA